MSTTTWIALRYLRASRRRFAGLITWVSLVGLTLGVLVLTAVVSVMNGFDTELKERLLGAVPHLLVQAAGREDVHLSRLLGQGADRPYDFFMGSGMVTANGAVNPVQVYGIHPEDAGRLRLIAERMTFGQATDLRDTPAGMLLGGPLARHLGLLPGDRTALILSEPVGGGVRPRLVGLRAVGTFELGAELDYSLVVVPLAALGSAPERLGRFGVRVDLDDPMRAPLLAAALRDQNEDWHVTTWADHYGELFQAVQMEKVMMFIALLMVVAVAAFNIVSGQMMVVNDKTSAIAILRTMGAPTSTITRVFLLQGVIISSLGIGVGLLLGVLAARYISAIFAAAERMFGLQFLTGTYFVELPSVVKVPDLFVIGAISWGLCLLSAWIPARRAALINPLEGLHRG